MKFLKTVLCCVMVLAFCISAFSVNAAFESQQDDMKLICDLAVEYVNSGSKDVFTEYMSAGIEEIIADGQFKSGKFVHLYEEDPELTDKENNQLSATIAVIGDIYVNGGDAVLTQDDINENVTPGYGDDTGLSDYQDDDAEVFMGIIDDYKAKLSSSPAAPKNETTGDEKNDAMPPEKNENAAETSEAPNGGTSVGVVIFISILVSAIVFVAGTFALRQVESKKPNDNAEIDDDDIFNLRLAVKSMQTSLQKADGNFKELDKLRIQVDEIDEKLEHITEYLRKLNRTE